MEYSLEELDNRIYPICDKWYLRRKLMLRSRGQCKGVKWRKKERKRSGEKISSWPITEKGEGEKRK